MKLKPKVLRKKKKNKERDYYPEENNPFSEKSTKSKKTQSSKATQISTDANNHEVKDKKAKVKKKDKRKESFKVKKITGDRERAFSSAILNPEEKIVNVRKKTVLQQSIQEVEEERKKAKNILKKPKLISKKKKKNKNHRKDKARPENEKVITNPDPQENKAAELIETVRYNKTVLPATSREPQSSIVEITERVTLKDNQNVSETNSSTNLNSNLHKNSQFCSNNETNVDTSIPQLKKSSLNPDPKKESSSETESSAKINHLPLNPFEEDSDDSEYARNPNQAPPTRSTQVLRKQRGHTKMQRTSSIVISSKNRKKKKRLKIIQKFKKKKLDKQESKEQVTETFINPKPTSKPAANTEGLQREVEEIQSVLSDRVIEGLLERQSNLNSLLKKSESLEDFAGTFAQSSRTKLVQSFTELEAFSPLIVHSEEQEPRVSLCIAKKSLTIMTSSTESVDLNNSFYDEISLIETNRDIVRKEKTKAKCCGLFSRSRFCWFICTCDRGLKRKKKKRKNLPKDGTESVLLSRAEADNSVEDEPYEKKVSSSLPNLSKPVPMRNKNLNNHKATQVRNSNSSKDSTTSLLASLQSRRILNRLNRTSFPLANDRGFSKVNTTQRKTSSADNILSLADRSPLLDAEARNSIHDNMNRYEDKDVKQKAYELLVMDYH